MYLFISLVFMNSQFCHLTIYSDIMKIKRIIQLINIEICVLIHEQSKQQELQAWQKMPSGEIFATNISI